MLLISLGMVLFSLGLLRAVQDLAGSSLDGAWSFVPYVVGVVFSALVIVFALSRVRRTSL